jgi:hypothetical protein
MNRFSGRDRIFNRFKWTKWIAGLIALTVVLAIQLNYAIGPSLPLEFEDEAKQRDPWKVSLRIDPRQIRLVKIERQIYTNGKRLRAESMQPYIEKPSQDRENIAELSLRFADIEKLAPGAYAQKIVVEGNWIYGDSKKPLHLERWFYFAVGNGDVRRINLEQYSNIVEKMETTLDKRGEKIPIYTGIDLKGAIPLSRTKGTFAVPVDPFGGATQEQLPKDIKRKKQEVDRSEVNEK